MKINNQTKKKIKKFHLTFIINTAVIAKNKKIKKNTLYAPAYLQTNRTCNVRK